MHVAARRRLCQNTRVQSLHLRSLAVLFGFALAGACASTESATGGDPDGGGSGGTGATGATGGGGSGGLVIDSPSDGPGPGSTLVYAHTDTVLFQVDPTQATPDLKQLGAFDCVGNGQVDPAMTDVAVDKDGQLWGISHTQIHLLEIQGQVVHCATSIPLDNPADVKFYALTFAPVGVLDPAKEVLVGGNTAGELWAIDPQGKLTQVGSFGNVPATDGNGNLYPTTNQGKPWELSGDIVFVENDGNPIGFATVRDCPDPPTTTNCSKTDTLLEIDVPKLTYAGSASVTKAVRGQIVKKGGCNDGVTGPYGSMYGITTWADKVYGFSRTGNLVEIDTSDGSACLLSAYTGADFGGAGVTTKAVVVPPPPK